MIIPDDETKDEESIFPNMKKKKQIKKDVFFSTLEVLGGK